jgi:hypothetical protein
MIRIVLLTIVLSVANTVFAFDHNHAAFAKLLQQNVKRRERQTLVNYFRIKQHPELIKGYISSITAVTLNEFNQFSSNQRLAFLINAYNALTIKLIVDNYPLNSIKDIGNFFRSTWKIKFFTLLGEKMHLDHIEHQLIRPKFLEPRIHFVVNCASIGCPSLLSEPIVATKLEMQLEAAAKSFVGNKSKNKLSADGQEIGLSKIFQWYGDDFNAKFGSPLQFIARYIVGLDVGKVQVDYLDYNWSLNEFKK